ncbi:phosphotransferase [Rhizobium sp. RU36D]|uniref:phosphotransferase enzyme family protein n=1 Tax=Rhizobium sp. RU36D TaxID=1907415 RepID=UPI0009D8D26A|nr:phosphotransferase [Rhizobium sp. RU36D]SMC98565.1 Ser/Thr protein kinase RdoA involved in Cpx stress response, MazF antagonist [Rhizobium sp. RU36D]
MIDFRPLYSTAQLAAVEEFITAHYPVAAPVSCMLLQRGLNDTYLVKTADGARYVFRLSHHRVRGPADVKGETNFISHLAASGVPVAAPVATRDGALFVSGQAAEGMREGVLFQHLDGRDPQPAVAADARATGRTLALLHNAAETYKGEGAVYRLDLDHLLHRPLARIRDSGIVEGQPMLDLEAIADRTATTIEAMSGLTWTYCHGDTHGFNSRINASGEAVFFDFDDSGPGYLAYDLAVFLWAKVSFGRAFTAAWQAFVDGYRAYRPISDADFQAVLPFVIVRHVWLMGDYASRAPEWGVNSMGWLAGQTEFLAAWETEQMGNRLF